LVESICQQGRHGQHATHRKEQSSQGQEEATHTLNSVSIDRISQVVKHLVGEMT
jgi:hypothetical protein